MERLKSASLLALATVLAVGILAVLNYYPLFAGIEAKVREGANVGNLGTWAYDPMTGKVFIACTHPGYKGEVWNSY